MKLKNIYIYHLKSKKKFSNSPLPTFFKEGFTFIIIDTDDHISGYGEPSPYIDTPKRLIKLIEKIFVKYFQNKDLHQINLSSLKKKLKKKSELKILSSFDQAILDIKAKEKKISVVNLISNSQIKKNQISFYASGGMINENQRYEDIVEKVLELKEIGYSGFKFRPMMPVTNLTHSQRIKNPPSFDSKKLANFSNFLRQKVGEDFKLMIDFGCRCKVNKETKYLFDTLYNEKFYFIEEPFKRSLKSYRKFSKLSKVKIAMGEHIYDHRIFQEWKKKNLISFFQPDSNLLLFDELKFISNKMNKSQLIIHNWCNQINFCSNLSFALSLNKPLMIEKNILENPYNNYFNIYNFNIKRGKLFFKNKSGLGVEFTKKRSRYLDVYEKKV